MSQGPRRRRNPWGIALAVTATAVVTGLGYYWWACSEFKPSSKDSSGEDEGIDDHECTNYTNGHHTGDDREARHCRPCDRETQRQLDINAHVNAHYQSIQKIARDTTVTTLLSPLSHNIKSMDDMDEIIARLQNEKGSLTTAEKLHLWESVLDRVLCRFICVVWLVPMLQLMVRVQLNVMGRSLYLQTSLSGNNDVERLHPRLSNVPNSNSSFSNPSRLSNNAQETFLRLSEHVVCRGCYILRDMASGIALEYSRELLGRLGSVGATVRDSEMAEAIGDALAAFERERLEADGWVAWETAIMPSENEFRGMLDVAVMDGNERGEVDGMWRETVRVYQSNAFRTMYLAGCARALAAGMLRGIGGDGEPLVRVLPRVARVIDQATRDAAFSHGLMGERLEELSASVYAGANF